MALTARGVAHIEANRAKIRAARTETVTLVSYSGGATGYASATSTVWHDVGKVAAGVLDRVGFITRQPYDALVEFPEEQTWDANLRFICRTATATAAGVAAATDRLYEVLDRIKIGMGVDASSPPSQGNRWLLKLRRLRYEL